MLTYVQAWTQFAELEKNVEEVERARAIYELAISQQALDMPETLWKAYIDFEIEQEETENVRTLYERLLERTKHVKVWISFAQFEGNHGGGMEVRVSHSYEGRGEDGVGAYRIHVESSGDVADRVKWC